MADSQKCLSVGTASYTPSNGRSSREIIPYALYRQQLLNAFLCHFIPASQLGFAGERSWLALLPELATPTKALEVSTMALCMAKLGRENDDLVLVKESLSLYTQGLWEMQKALWDPQLTYRDETLGACMALAMYEIVECPAANRHAYVSHQDGCTKLVELRGAEAHGSGFGHEMFLAFRRQSILQALGRHQSTYLSTPAWLSKPWLTHPKRPIDQVFDFFSLAPEIFKQADKIDGLSPHDALHEILEVIGRCWKIDAAVEQFYADFESKMLGPLYWPELSREISSVDDVELGKVFPVAFHFLNLKMATALMFYWATLLMLRSGLCRLYQAIPTLDLSCREIACCCISCKDKTPNDDSHTHAHKFSMSQPPPLDHCSDFPSMAWNICQSVEYCMQESMLGLGPASVSAPLTIVNDTLKALPGYRREVSWAEAAITKVTERGLRMLKY